MMIFSETIPAVFVIETVSKFLLACAGDNI